MVMIPADLDDRIAWFTDADSFRETQIAAASPYLARWGIAAVKGDGVRIGRARVNGKPVLLLAQDPSFLGGAVGARQGAAMAKALREASRDDCAGAILLLESGGVRLHESLPALLALAEVLRAVCDLAVQGIPSVAVVLGSGCFGGMSVVASACAHTFIEPESRLGVSGPRVIETLCGSGELDASDPLAVAAVYGAAARARAGLAALLPSRPEAAKARLAEVLCAARSAALDLEALDARLAARLQAEPQAALEGHWRPAPPWVAADDLSCLWHWPEENLWLLPPIAPAVLGPASTLVLGRALRRFTRDADESATLVVIEATAGHELSRSAEAEGLAQYLAYLALAHAEARARGRQVIGVLAGDGVSAAFFSHALQTAALYATPEARVRLMDARAMERVTGLPRAEIEALLEDDAVLGQPVRHLFEYAALSGVLPDLEPSSLLAAARMS